MDTYSARIKYYRQDHTDGVVSMHEGMLDGFAADDFRDAYDRAEQLALKEWGGTCSDGTELTAPYIVDIHRVPSKDKGSTEVLSLPNPATTTQAMTTPAPAKYVAPKPLEDPLTKKLLAALVRPYKGGDT